MPFGIKLKGYLIVHKKNTTEMSYIDLKYIFAPRNYEKDLFLLKHKLKTCSYMAGIFL